jgi:hypothetical protein
MSKNCERPEKCVEKRDEQADEKKVEEVPLCERIEFSDEFNVRIGYGVFPLEWVRDNIGTLRVGLDITEHAGLGGNQRWLLVIGGAGSSSGIGDSRPKTIRTFNESEDAEKCMHALCTQLARFFKEAEEEKEQEEEKEEVKPESPCLEKIPIEVLCPTLIKVGNHAFTRQHIIDNINRIDYNCTYASIGFVFFNDPDDNYSCNTALGYYRTREDATIAIADLREKLAYVLAQQDLEEEKQLQEGKEEIQKHRERMAKVVDQINDFDREGVVRIVCGEGPDGEPIIIASINGLGVVVGGFNENITTTVRSEASANSWTLYLGGVPIHTKQWEFDYESCVMDAGYNSEQFRDRFVCAMNRFSDRVMRIISNRKPVAASSGCK